MKIQRERRFRLASISVAAAEWFKPEEGKSIEQIVTEYGRSFDPPVTLEEARAAMDTTPRMLMEGGNDGRG